MEKYLKIAILLELTEVDAVCKQDTYIYKIIVRVCI